MLPKKYREKDVYYRKILFEKTDGFFFVRVDPIKDTNLWYSYEFPKYYYVKNCDESVFKNIIGGNCIDYSEHFIIISEGISSNFFSDNTPNCGRTISKGDCQIIKRIKNI